MLIVYLNLNVKQDETSMSKACVFSSRSCPVLPSSAFSGKQQWGKRKNITKKMSFNYRRVASEGKPK